MYSKLVETVVYLSYKMEFFTQFLQNDISTSSLVQFVNHCCLITAFEYWPSNENALLLYQIVCVVSLA